MAQEITGIVGPLGPGIQLTCTGLDLNEMVPIPILVGALQVPANETPHLEELPPPPAGSHPWDSYLRYDSEKRLAYLPLVGGPSIEPAAVSAAGRLLIGTSRAAVEGAIASPTNTKQLSQPANLYIRAEPPAIVQIAIGALREFAEMNMLHGYTLETFNEATKGWQASANRVREAVLVASGTDEMIDAELSIICAPPETTPKQ